MIAAMLVLGLIGLDNSGWMTVPPDKPAATFSKSPLAEEPVAPPPATPDTPVSCSCSECTCGCSGQPAVTSLPQPYRFGDAWRLVDRRGATWEHQDREVLVQFVRSLD